MLRKAAANLRVPTKGSRRNDDEKGAKITNQKVQRAKSTVLFLGFVCLIGMVALYSFKDSTDFHPFSEGYLRARGLKKKDSSTSLLQYDSELPQNSIYRVSVKGAEGDLVDLDQFSGMVSLVVNTACR